jgi:predicted AAA+ superfamily ATPase
MIYGVLPYLLHLKNEEQYKPYLINLFDEVYIKDILERNRIERTDILGDILNVLSTFISSLTNPLHITNTLKTVRKDKLSSNTVSDYISYCEEAFLICETQRYDVKGKHYFDYPKKYYFTDIVLRNARLGFRQLDSGHIMENIIYNELLIRGYSVDIGVVVDRRGGKNIQKEIDFVVNKGDKRVYIQSAWQMNTNEKITAEFDSLKLAKNFFAKIIIQNDIPSHYTDNDGIIHCNLIEFLLKPELISLG